MVIKPIRMPQELIDEIKNTGREISEFTRSAIKNELEQNDDAVKEVRRMNKKIDAIDAGSIHGAISDLVLTSHVIFEEVKKQNEIIKLLLKQANRTFQFAYMTWEKEHTEKLGDEYIMELDDDTNSTFKQLKI